MPAASPIGTADGVLLDQTETDQYQRLVAEEIEHYDNVTITETLTEGGVHAFECWRFYFEYLHSKHCGTSFCDAVWDVLRQRQAPRVLSLGCGYGGHDLTIARGAPGLGELIAVDLNPKVYDRASRTAEAEGLPIHFQSLDLNRVEIRPGYFDVIYAVASIHHILNLEHLFTQLERGLKDDGRFIVVDIIGKTQVEFWRENVEHAAGVVSRLPRRFRPKVGRRRFWRRWLFNPYTVINPYVEPRIQAGMEGIRQEEIVPLLDRWFRAENVFYYDAYMRLLCTNAFLGPLLDPAERDNRVILESLIDDEMQTIAAGKLRPTEVFGIYAKKSA